MIDFYIDESGSLNNKLSDKPYFIISFVRPLKKRYIKSYYLNFLKLYKDDLTASDNCRFENGLHASHMFAEDGSFEEFKGSQMTRDLKKRFCSDLLLNDAVNVYYISIDNRKLTDKFCENKARAFNYSVKQFVEEMISENYICADEDIFLNIDNRNIRPDAQYFLSDYLNTELTGKGMYTGTVSVKYHDSKNVRLIQIADVFANMFYSHMMNGQYTDIFDSDAYSSKIPMIFDFPK